MRLARDATKEAKAPAGLLMRSKREARFPESAARSVSPSGALDAPIEATLILEE